MTEVFVLAVVASLDAGLLAAAVVLLGRPRPVQQLLAYLIGGMGLSIVFGLLIVLALHGSKLLRAPSSSTSAVIEVVAGGLLIVVAVAVRSGRALHWHPRKTSRGETERPQQSLYDRALGHDSVWIAWAAGAVYSVPGAYYLAGLALLAKLGQPAATNVLAILGFNLIMFALIELPLLGFVLAPDRTRFAHREAQRLDDGPPTDLDRGRSRRRRHLPRHLGVVRPRLNANITPPRESHRLAAAIEGPGPGGRRAHQRAGFANCATPSSAAVSS